MFFMSPLMHGTCKECTLVINPTSNDDYIEDDWEMQLTYIHCPDII